MTEQGTYTIAEWNKDKILILKLLEKKKYEEADKFVQICFINADKSVENQLNGALFILDYLASVPKTDGPIKGHFRL